MSSKYPLVRNSKLCYEEINTANYLISFIYRYEK